MCGMHACAGGRAARVLEELGSELSNICVDCAVVIICNFLAPCLGALHVRALQPGLLCLRHACGR